REMLEQAFLGRLVIVRRDLQRTVGARVLSGFGEINGFARRVGAGPGKHLRLARRKFNRTLDYLDVLFVIQRGRFACCSDRYDAVDPRFYLGLDEAPQRGFIDVAGSKRRDDCWVCSSKFRCHSLSLRSRPSAGSNFNAPVEDKIGRTAQPYLAE